MQDSKEVIVCVDGLVMQNIWRRCAGGRVALAALLFVIVGVQTSCSGRGEFRFVDRYGDGPVVVEVMRDIGLSAASPNGRVAMVRENLVPAFVRQLESLKIAANIKAGIKWEMTGVIRLNYPSGMEEAVLIVDVRKERAFKIEGKYYVGTVAFGRYLVE